jgi:hypothetical protein
VVKERVSRGTRKRFYTTITDLSGIAVDPDYCWVKLIKSGAYGYDEIPWVVCSKVGDTGVWGADIWLDETWTLGDWVARFKWTKASVEDSDEFEFTLERKDKPYDSTATPEVFT